MNCRTIPIQMQEITQVQLNQYGKQMRHEIYRITALFQKQKRSFAYPIRYLNDEISLPMRRMITDQAIQFFQLRMIHPEIKHLPYIICVPKECYTILPNSDELLLHLGVRRQRRTLSVTLRDANHISNYSSLSIFDSLYIQSDEQGERAIFMNHQCFLLSKLITYAKHLSSSPCQSSPNSTCAY